MTIPGGVVVKNPPANAEDVDSIPGMGRSPGVRNGNSLRYSYLRNLFLSFHGQRSQVGHTWGSQESDMTEQHACNHSLKGPKGSASCLLLWLYVFTACPFFHCISTTMTFFLPLFFPFSGIVSLEIFCVWLVNI